MILDALCQTTLNMKQILIYLLYGKQCIEYIKVNRPKKKTRLRLGTYNVIET